ncbi:immunoglobulin-like domain-containing protein [Fusicatenibacter sp.]
MKKGIVAGMIILCVALGAGTAAVAVSSDRKGPEIEVPSGADVTYEEGSDTAFLLEGVTAVDDRDGDVTSSLVIENIFLSDDHTSASVIYAAKDSHNNVTKVTRRVNYKASAGDAAEADSSDAGAPETAAEEPKQNDTEGVKNETNAQMEIDALPAEAPKLYLNTYEVTVEAGTELDQFSYIKEITDDADSQETLFGEIQIDGDVDTAAAGDYTLTYHVTDSDGNQSNAAVLTVHVQ